jgi:transposase
MLTSLDLRRRIVHAYENGEGTQKTLATRFAVGFKTVKNLLRLKRETNDIKPKKHAGGPSHKISDLDLKKLEDLVAEKSDRTIKELREQWGLISGIKISHATMFRALKRAKLTLKKRPSGQVNATQKRTKKGARNSKPNLKRCQ